MLGERRRGKKKREKNGFNLMGRAETRIQIYTAILMIYRWEDVFV
jgi:hypothetical protein